MNNSEGTITTLQQEIASLKQQIQDQLSNDNLFASLLEQAGDAHFVVENNVFVECNRAFIDMLGCSSKEEVLQLQPSQISPEYQPDGCLSTEKQHEALVIVLEKGHHRFEWLHQRITGETFPVEVSLNVATYNGRTVIYGNWRDISERKDAERKLRQSEQKARAIINTSPDVMVLVDREGRTIELNDIAVEVIGRTREDIVGKQLSELFPPEVAQDRIAYIEEVVRTGTMVRHQEKIGDVYLDNTLAPVLDEDGQVMAISISSRDISDQMRSQEENEVLQQQVIDAQQAAIRELSTPLIPLSHDVVLMPLVGSVDTARAGLVMETLLEGIAQYQAATAILDITGVMVVDTQVANALIQATQAAQLLGTQVILTGIGPTMAQTLVHLGADLSGIKTYGRLQSAIAAALLDRSHG